MNYSQVTFIDIDFVSFLNYDEEAKKIAAERKWKYDEVKGDIRLMRKLIDSEWNEDEFLFVPSGEEIVTAYDEKIIACKQPI